MNAAETQKIQSIEELRSSLGLKLVRPEGVRAPDGLPTGWSALDQYVLWQGFPKGALSLLHGPSGLGATSLWIQAASRITQSTRWCAWLSSSQGQLSPWALRKHNVALRHLVVISAPKNAEQRLWALQELLSLSLFESVACDLGTETMRDHHLVQLRQLSARAQCATVLISQRPLPRSAARFALVGEFTSQGLNLTRALHRPIPHLLPRRDQYADLMPQLTQG